MQPILLILSVLAMICRSDASNLRGQPSQRDFRIGTGGYAAIRAQAQPRFTTSSAQARANQPPSVKTTRSLKKAGESREETGMKTLYARPTVRVPQGSLTPSAPSPPKVIAPSVQVSFPTVDVFFFLDFLGGQKYVRKEYFWMLPKVAAMYARANTNGTESDTRIHVVSSSIDILEQASQLGFYSHDLNYQMKQYPSLLSRIATTVKNDRQERKVLRWKAFHDIVSEWNTDAPESPIKRVMVMEDDVLLTVNAAALFERTLKAAALFERTLKAAAPSTELVSLANGVSIFSVSGLASFSAFIDEWYSGSTEDIEARSMYAENREWTDALLLKRFIATPASSTAPSSSPALAPRLAWFTSSEAKFPSVEQERLSNVLGCVPQESYKVNSNIHFEVDGLVMSGSAPSRITNTTQIGVKSAQEKQPYCFLHFQERNHKTLLYAYGRSLEILRQGDEKYSVSARDNLAGDMLLQPENSQEIYHISSDAVMKFIPSQEVFNSRSFTAEDIISNVPMAVITAFKPSPDPAHPFKDGQTVQFVGRSRTVYLVKDGVLHPIASGQVFERLHLKFEDVIKDKTYSGPVFNTLPFGIELQ